MMKFNALVFTAMAVLCLFSCNTTSLYEWRGDSLMSNESGDTVLTVSADAAEGLSQTDFSIEELNEGLYRVSWTFKAENDTQDAWIHADVKNGCSEWWMLPSISYNGNPWGHGQDPKGASDGENGWWTYSYRRSPIPGAIYSENSYFAVATWGDVPQNEEEDFSFSIMPMKDCTVHRIIWPEEEKPRTYWSRDKYADGWRDTCMMKCGDIKQMSVYVDVTPTKEGHKAISHFLANAWKLAEKKTFDLPSSQQLWEWGIRFVKEYQWDPQGDLKGFRTGVVPLVDGEDHGMENYGDFFEVIPGDEGKWRKIQGYQSGWVGQNISLGCSLLADYLKTGDTTSLSMGISTLDSWAGRYVADKGLFPTEWQGNWYDACHMGTVSIMYREAYKLAAKCGYERPQYLDIALGICDCSIKSQKEDGSYCRCWDADGQELSYDGFTATYILPAMVEAYCQTNDEKYLQSVRSAFNYFKDAFYSSGFTTNGALDTDCIDKESCLPFFIAAVRLYEVLKEKEYLDDAIALGYYISTWLWCYDGVYPENDSFTIHSFHTFGGTAISTQHQALDTFGLLPVEEMRRLSEYTGDPQWKEKADAMWNFCCQLISDGNLEINGRIRPVGGQSEAFFQAEWKLYSNRSRFDNWLVSWPNALRLQILRNY